MAWALVCCPAYGPACAAVVAQVDERLSRQDREQVIEKLSDDENGLRIRVETADGVFLVYDAKLPQDGSRDVAGYLAYWDDSENGELYVYGRLLFDRVDVGQALLNLEPDLGIDPAALMAASGRLDEAATLGEAEGEDDTVWHLLTKPLVLEIMGFAPPPDVAGDLLWTGGIMTSVGVKGCADLKADIYCPGGCWDGNPCTADLCNHKTCSCYYEFLDGRGCDDGNPNTTCWCLGASCHCHIKDCPAPPPCKRLVLVDGTCIAEAADEGAICGDEQHPCTEYRCQDGQCNALCVDEASCDDGDPCTLGDICHECLCWGEEMVCDEEECKSVECVDGECEYTLWGDYVVCSDDGDSCTRDVCLDGECEHPDSPDGSGCDDDGNPCTHDKCLDGSCDHPPKGDGTSCPDEGNPCTYDECMGGNCDHPPKENGTSCPDDGDQCTDDECNGGACEHPPKCTGVECCQGECCQTGETCCGEVICCLPQRCCSNDVCCEEDCEECLDNGTLSGGIIDVSPDPACVGDTITFTLSGVVDSGGTKRVDCYSSTDVPPVAPEYTWELTVPPDYPAPLPPLSGSGTSASVAAIVGGTYTCTFTATADRDCPPSAHIVGPVMADTCHFSSVAAYGGETCDVTVTLKEITFTGDHGMYESAAPYDQGEPSQGWGAGEALSGVDWRSEDNPDHPVYYTRSSPLSMTVAIEVTASGGGTATLRVVGEDGLSGTKDFAVPCGTELQTVEIGTTDLPGVVEAYEPMLLIWSVKAPGKTEFAMIGATQHNAYLGYATPLGGPPTKERMSFLCNAAIGQSAQVAVTDGIHEALDADPPNDPPEHDPPRLLTDDWPIMCPERLPSGEIYVGWCDHQARFMLRGMKLMGIAGSTYNTFASSDTTVHIEESKMEGGQKYWLKFDFDDNGEVDNNFEGSVIAHPRYYTVWPSLTADSECRLLLQVGPDAYGATQRWVQTRYDDFWETVLDTLPGTQDYPSCP